MPVPIFVICPPLTLPSRTKPEVVVVVLILKVVLPANVVAPRTNKPLVLAPVEPLNTGALMVRLLMA